MASHVVEELAKIDLFSSLSDPILERLANTCFRRSFPAGETIIREYETGASLYLILKGRVTVTKLDELGERVHIAERGPGEYLGEMSLLDGGPRSSDVITLEESDFLVLDRNSFVRCIEESPELAIKIISKLCHRLRQADEERSSNRPVRERLAMLIYKMAAQRAKDGAPRLAGGGIELSAPRRELAERVRAARETVSRELGFIAESGALRIDGRRIVVTDPGALKRFFA